MMVMMTTMTSQVKASSSGSSTGVSVREPLNVRLQRLLSSDQSSAYTILDILQVCFDRSFYLYLRMLRVFPCTCSFYVLVLENVKSICLHPFLLFVLENGLFVLENVKSISLHPLLLFVLENEKSICLHPFLLLVLENVKSISLRMLRVFPCTLQAPRTSQAEIIKFLRGVTARIEEEARRRVRVPF